MELGYYKLVYFTPEQLQRGYVLDSLKRAHDRVGVRYVALDEAHCISQWGHDFRPSYLNLVKRLKDKGVEPVRIALTATASPKVRTDLCQELQLDSRPLEEGRAVFVHSSNRPELNLIVRVVRSSVERAESIVEALKGVLAQNRSNPRPGAAIAFLPYTGGNPSQTTDTPDAPNAGRLSPRVNRFAAYLEKALGRRVAFYHSKMDDNVPVEEEAAAGYEACNWSEDIYEEEISTNPLGSLSKRSRRGEQNSFIRGRREIMVATNGFGMGIDKPDIRLIVHRTAPTNLEAYAQEAGRAGRDGDLADVLLFHSPDSPDCDDGQGPS